MHGGYYKHEQQEKKIQSVSPLRLPPLGFPSFGFSH